MNELTPWRVRRLARPENVETNHVYAAEPDEVPLSFCWNILKKRRNLIFSIFLLFFAAGAYFALSSTRIYTAAATIKIEPNSPRVTGVAGVGELQPSDMRDYDYYQTQFALLKGRPLAAKVITDLGLESNKAFTDAKIITPNPIERINSWVTGALRIVTPYLSPLFTNQPELARSAVTNLTDASGKVPLEISVTPDAIGKYLRFLTIVQVPKTRLVSVQFTTPHPALSQALANAHVQSFMRMSLENSFSLTKEARDFLDQKKAELGKKLEMSEAALNKFRRMHGVVSVEKGENIVVDRLVELNRQLTAARAQRIEAESLHRTAENKNHQDLAEIMKQGLVQQLNSNVANLEAEKARLGSIFKPDHPRMQELNQQIVAARQAFNSEITNVVRGIKSNYAAAAAKERGLESEAAKQQGDALRLRELGVNYTLLEEDVKANRSLYESVLKRLSETNVSNDLAISNMQIAETAAMPASAAGPNVPLFLVATMASGLFLGVGIAFIRDFFDSALGTPDDVWRSVGLGTLGVVPHLRFSEGRNQGSGIIKRVLSLAEPTKTATNTENPSKELIISHSPLSLLNEFYRAIRTSLLLSQAEKPPQIILLTSPSPGEGKTVTSLNLAIALAQDGYSVLLVDGDMRKGCCHERLGLSRSAGLSNVLTGRVSLQDGIQQTPIERLSLMSRGAPPPNPSELLGSAIMKETLKDLRDIYNFILIDSPPVIGISDAAILSVVVDGVLLVLDGRSTSTPCAQKAVERLDMVRARMLGVILNGVDLRDPHYSYFRSYDQYYTYRNADDGMDTNGNRSGHVSGDYGNGNGDLRQNGALRVVAAGKSVDGSKVAPGFNDVEAIFAESLSNLSQPEGLVSQTALSRVVEALTKSIGPLAPKIVQEHIASLGESRYAFPENRINELLLSLKAAMTDEQLKSFSTHLVGNHSTSFKS